MGLAVAAAVLSTSIAGCGRSRDEYEDDFKQLVQERGDLPPAQVDCIMDGFFAEMSDGEVRAFSRRDELTPTEAQRIRDLTAACQAAG